VKQTFSETFTSDIFNLILKSMNSIRDERNLIRKGDMFKKPWVEDDFLRFLSVVLCMSSTQMNSFQDYFKAPHPNTPNGSHFVRARMCEYTFCEMFRCFSVDIDKVIDMVNQNNVKIWSPSTYMTMDESMAPTKSRKNPHHVFIKRKPHPHGVKFVTLGDMNLFLFRSIMHKRMNYEPLEKAFITDIKPIDRSENLSSSVMEKIKKLTEEITGKILVGDNWFGGVQYVKYLSSIGNHSIFSCKSDRPSIFFSNGLHQKTFEGFISGFTISQEGKVFYYCTCKKETEDDELDEDEKKSTKKVNYLSDIIRGDFHNEGTPLIQSTYRQVSGSIDRINKSIMEKYLDNKKGRWRTSVLVWILFSQVHNGRIIYNNIRKGLPGFKELSQSEYIDILMYELFPVDLNPNTHTMKKMENKSNCKICYHLKNEFKSNTYNFCCGCNEYFHPDCVKEFHTQFMLKRLCGEF